MKRWRIGQPAQSKIHSGRETDMTWNKLPPVDLGCNPCLHCPDPLPVLDLESRVAVGFGDAHVERDSEIVWYEGNREYEDCITVAQVEEKAAKDPDHDWRIVKFGPLHGEVYQRHGDKQWVCIERNEGFA